MLEHLWKPFEFIASLPIVVPANFASLASLCIGDFLVSISVFPLPFLSLVGEVVSIAISTAATVNEHFLPPEPDPVTQLLLCLCSCILNSALRILSCKISLFSECSFISSAFMLCLIP